MQTIEVSRRLAIWTIVGVCVLSAAIGAGIALLAETGPTGPRGRRGESGKQGPRGPEGTVEAPDFGALEAEVEELRGELTDLGDLESKVDGIDSDLTETEETVSELCFEVGSFC